MMIEMKWTDSSVSLQLHAAHAGGQSITIALSTATLTFLQSSEPHAGLLLPACLPACRLTKVNKVRLELAPCLRLPKLELQKGCSRSNPASA